MYVVIILAGHALSPDVAVHRVRRQLPTIDEASRDPREGQEVEGVPAPRRNVRQAKVAVVADHARAASVR